MPPAELSYEVLMLPQVKTADWSSTIPGSRVD